ncbi:MAG TPA: hypothetical protein VF533_19100 [Solirubrobacteraceae bacterium]|jgi:hypothetical protein
MERHEAERRAAELNETHPDRARYHWLVRKAGDGWDLARVPVPAGHVDPLKTTVEAKPKPAEPDDPRPAFIRNVGGPWAT